MLGFVKRCIGAGQQSIDRFIPVGHCEAEAGSDGDLGAVVCGGRTLRNAQLQTFSQSLGIFKISVQHNHELFTANAAQQIAIAQTSVNRPTRCRRRPQIAGAPNDGEGSWESFSVRQRWWQGAADSRQSLTPSVRFRSSYCAVDSGTRQLSMGAEIASLGG